MGVQEFKEHHLSTIRELRNQPASMDFRWHADYISMLNTVQNIRSELENGSKLAPSNQKYKTFLYKLLAEKYNGIADMGMQGLKAGQFEDFIKDESILSAVENLIKQPNDSASEKLGDAIRQCNLAKGYVGRDGEPNNWAIVNRVAAACTDDIVSVISRPHFYQTFHLLACEKKIIGEYLEKSNYNEGQGWIKEMKEREWYNESKHLMAGLKEIFKDEIASGETDAVFLSIYTWILFRNYIKGKNTEPRISIKQ